MLGEHYFGRGVIMTDQVEAKRMGTLICTKVLNSCGTNKYVIITVELSNYFAFISYLI